MKASEFKNLIKEAVREAIREELSEVVQQPTAPIKEQVKYTPTGNAMLDALNETRAGMTSTDYQNITGGNLKSSLAQSFDRSAFMPKQNFQPTSDNPEIIAQSVATAPKVGLDLSQLGFINKAAAIVNTSNKKDREKAGN